MRLPLLGGYYTARSIIANCQRCVNLYPEANPKDSPVPLTHYQRPGLRALVQGAGDVGNRVVRGIYRASNGAGYCVIGSQVYAISADFVLTNIGSITVGRTNPVSFIDNGQNIMLVDGSVSGWTISMASNVFAPIVDPTGLFTGATRLDFIDTFMIWNIPGTNRFGATGSNSTLPPDALNFGAKTNYPDPIQTLIVNRHEILLIGQLKSEIWFDAGGATFPFAELPGAYIEHGTCAPYSIASEDINTFWLGQDLQGRGVVFRQRGYETKRISTHAIEFAIQQYPVMSDAIGYCYQQGGHVFYVLQFPSGNATWVWDESTALWHQEAWTDENGVLNRHRGNCHAFVNDLNVVGDFENGTLYALDQDVYTDEVNGTQGPITFIRSFPHIGAGMQDGQSVPVDGKRVQFEQFLADIECGNGPQSANGKPAQLSLRWSDDRGKTFGNAVLQSAGMPGSYLTQPQWRGLGIARDRIFELEYSIAGPAALNGAWVKAIVLAD